MRKFNNIKQVEKANILAEQRYLKTKGLINEDFSDGDADDAAFQDYYKAIVGEEEGQFFAHFNTPKDALTAALKKVQQNSRNGGYFEPHILSGVLLGILSKVQ